LRTLIYDEEEIDILLGAEWLARVVINAPIIGPPGTPDILPTIFGHCLIGKIENKANKVHVFCSTLGESIEFIAKILGV
jgi:hypothetical protein